MHKPIIINFYNGVNNVIVTDKNDVISYPGFSGAEIENMVNAVKVEYNDAAVINYVPDDLVSKLIKTIDVYSPVITGNEISYPLFLAESGRDDVKVSELTNFVNSI